MPRTTRTSRYSRYNRQTTVLEQVALIRRTKVEAPKRAAQEDLARILDGLNTWDALDDLREKRFARSLCSGPIALGGLEPVPYVSVVIWYRPAGYYGYKTLTVLGVWARADAGLTTIAVGAKRLAYSAPFYDAEAYHKLIRRNYDLYYKDDGLPPADSLVIPYHHDERLQLREVVAAELARRV